MDSQDFTENLQVFLLISAKKTWSKRIKNIIFKRNIFNKHFSIYAGTITNFASSTYELHIQIQQVLEVPHITFHAIWAFAASGDV